jgi:hypothetical protein
MNQSYVNLFYFCLNFALKSWKLLEINLQGSTTVFRIFRKFFYEFSGIFQPNKKFITVNYPGKGKEK